VTSLRYRHLLPGKTIWTTQSTDGRVHELAGVEDGVGTAKDIDELVRGRRLTPYDLVDRGSGWETIMDCELFDAACAPVLRRESLGRALRMSGVLLAFVLLVVLANYGPVAARLTPARLREARGILDVCAVTAILAELWWARQRKRSPPRD
jgi:hypothetical protein